MVKYTTRTHKSEERERVNRGGRKCKDWKQAKSQGFIQERLWHREGSL